MRIGIMQPYFFPYIGYFQLIHSVDKYINLDHVSFMKRSYMVRNSIKNDLSINIQVNNGSQNRRCKDVTVNFSNRWTNKLESTIKQLYSKENNYDRIMDSLIDPLLRSTDNEVTISEFNLGIINNVCNLLDINTDIVDTSEGLTNQKKGEGLKEICNKYNADSYVNAIGGRSLYDKEDFRKSGLDLYFCKMDDDIELDNPYSSIIDILFRYDISHVKKQILRYKLI